MKRLPKTKTKPNIDTARPRSVANSGCYGHTTSFVSCPGPIVTKSPKGPADPERDPSGPPNHNRETTYARCLGSRKSSRQVKNPEWCNTIPAQDSAEHIHAAAPLA